MALKLKRTDSLVEIQIKADAPGRIVALYPPDADPKKDAPLIHCFAPCSGALRPGEYMLTIAATKTTADGATTITIEEPSTVVIRPETFGTRWTGLTLGIVGTVALPTGLFLLLGAWINGASCALNEQHCGGGDGLANAGSIFLLGGLVLTPIGWGTYSSSYRPSVDIRPEHESSGRPRAWAVSLGGPRGSAGLQFRLSF